MLSKSFAEVHRVLAQDGLAVIVFSHKSTEAWETVINSLLSSGLVLTASWPVHTERTERLSAKETASLASSIYMVCRKRIKDEVAYYDEIKDEIKKRIKDKLAQFWNEGISGSDFFISAIGPAVEVFGRYSKVEKPSGEVVSAKDLLEYVRKVVMEFALERILKNPSLGGIDSETLFYLLWRWTYNRARVQFDDANKLAHGVGVELSNMWGQDGFVRKEKEFISVLDPRERAKEHSFLKKDKFNLMIDVLHRGLVYWEKTEKEKIKDLLDESGFSNNENFWKVSQAISEVLPEGDKEKQLIQGFLYSREAYSKIKKKEASLFAEDKK
jgi:adenine-specific DNA methylase